MNTGITLPNECVSDYSKTLLGAITRTFFNRRSLKEYINTCFIYLTSDKNQLPECYIRIDVAHMVHIICRWKCLSVRKPVKDFYIRTVGLLIKSNNIEDFKKMLEMIIIIASSETDGDDVNKQPTPSEQARTHLNKYISDGEIKISSEEFNNISYKGINSGYFFDDVDSDIINEDCLP